MGASPSCHVRPWGLATLAAVSSSEGPTSGTELRPSLLWPAAYGLESVPRVISVPTLGLQQGRSAPTRSRSP